jgi:hypothetical protein
LFDDTGSASVPATLAVLTTDGRFPVARTLMLTVALAPALSVLRRQVMVPLDRVQVPCLADTDENSTWVGSVSVTTTPVAGDGPPFVAVSA